MNGMTLHLLPCDPRVDLETADVVTQMLEDILGNEDFKFIHNWLNKYPLTDINNHQRYHRNFDFSCIHDSARSLVDCAYLYTKEHEDTLKQSNRYYYIYVESAYWLKNSFLKRINAYKEKLSVHRYTIELFDRLGLINEDRAIRDGLSGEVAKGIRKLTELDHAA